MVKVSDHFKFNHSRLKYSSVSRYILTIYRPMIFTAPYVMCKVHKGMLRYIKFEVLLFMVQSHQTPGDSVLIGGSVSSNPIGDSVHIGDSIPFTFIPNSLVLDSVLPFLWLVETVRFL